jgi:MFS family permease
MLLPQSLTWLVMSFTLGGLLLRFGSRRVMLGAGLLFFVASASCLLLTQDVLLVCVVGIIAATGFGLGAVMTSTMLIAQESVKYEIRGAAMGLANMLRSIGQTIGSGLFGLLFNVSLSSYFSEQGQAGIDISDPFALASTGVVSLELVQEGVWQALFTVFVALAVLALVVLTVSCAMPTMRFVSQNKPTMQQE